jgi:ceramide glucosyltransferase
MTCLYRGVAAQGGLWARLEAVGMSIEMTAGVLVANMIEGMQFVLGPTMAFRRATLKKMGGFRVTADYCADDFVLGNQTYLQGERVVLSHHIIDHMVINESFVQSMRHQARWMQSTRFSRPKGHFGTALTFSLPFGLLALVAGAGLGHLDWGVALLGWSILTRLAISLAAGRAVVRDPSWLALLILYPIRDLMGIGFWTASYLSSKVLWRGRIFQLLPGGKMRADK